MWELRFLVNIKSGQISVKPTENTKMKQKSVISHISGKNIPILNELMNNIDDDSTDFELLRQALIAESDAVNLYVQLARKCKSEQARKLLIDLAQEERVHIGELTSFLNKYSDSQKGADDKAKSELEDKNWFNI